MSLAQGNNTPTRPRIEPGSPDPEADALTIRPVRSPTTMNVKCKFILSSSDKETLKQYLKEVYKKKLNITLLPKWIELHVSDMFSPVILVDDKPLTTFEVIFCTDQCVKEIINDSKDNPKMPIFLLGHAGAGKSTFCKHLTDTWSHPHNVTSQFKDACFLERFNFLFYVSFRFAGEESSILDMIKNQLFSHKDESMWNVAKHVLMYHPELCLILSDGLD